MDTKKIFRVLHQRCKDTFLGVFACDRLPRRIPPKRPLLLVCNTHPHMKPGEHWVVIFIGENSTGVYVVV